MIVRVSANLPAHGKSHRFVNKRPESLDHRPKADRRPSTNRAERHYVNE
jgi:hypothetical protein